MVLSLSKLMLNKFKNQTRTNAMLKRSHYFILAAAFLSFLLSVYLFFTGQQLEGIFVGIWVPSILSLGIYTRTR